MMAKKYFVSKDQMGFTFDPAHPPALRVVAPCTITFETDDVGYRRLAQGESLEAIGPDNLNIVTGPVFFEGAEPGDALKIEVVGISIKSVWTVWIPKFGALGKQTTDWQIRNIPIENGYAVINPNLQVKLEPMIGCIGLAPVEGNSSTVNPVFPWGGNMDLRELSPGATIYLPVQVSGGLLSVGDLHAAMGSAEPTWVSLESAGEATLRISIEKGCMLRSPRLRIGNDTMILGMGKTLPEAIQMACEQAYEYLIQQGLKPFDAYAYASARVGLRLAGPAGYNVLAVIPDLER
jgi:amidase